MPCYEIVENRLKKQRVNSVRPCTTNTMITTTTMTIANRRKRHTHTWLQFNSIQFNSTKRIYLIEAIKEFNLLFIFPIPKRLMHTYRVPLCWRRAHSFSVKMGAVAVAVASTMTAPIQNIIKSIFRICTHVGLTRS